MIFASIVLCCASGAKSIWFTIHSFATSRSKTVSTAPIAGGNGMSGSSGLFNWIREGVRQSVLLGVSDALESIGAPDQSDKLHPALMSINSNRPAALMRAQILAHPKKRRNHLAKKTTRAVPQRHRACLQIALLTPNDFRCDPHTRNRYSVVCSHFCSLVA